MCRILRPNSELNGAGRRKDAAGTYSTDAETHVADGFAAEALF